MLFMPACLRRRLSSCLFFTEEVCCVLKMENRPEGANGNGATPRAAHSQNRRVTGEDGLFTPATVARIRKHSHKWSLVGNEAATLCVTEVFMGGAGGGGGFVKSLIKFCGVMRKFSTSCSRSSEIKKSLCTGRSARLSIHWLIQSWLVLLLSEADVLRQDRRSRMGKEQTADKDGRAKVEGGRKKEWAWGPREWMGPLWSKGLFIFLALKFLRSHTQARLFDVHHPNGSADHHSPVYDGSCVPLHTPTLLSCGSSGSDSCKRCQGFLSCSANLSGSFFMLCGYDSQVRVAVAAVTMQAKTKARTGLERCWALFFGERLLPVGQLKAECLWVWIRILHRV